MGLALILSACGDGSRGTVGEIEAPEPGAAVGTDYSLVTPAKMHEQELPIWQISNMPESAEAYYGPDSYLVIVQTQDDDAVPPSHARAAGGALTWITTDDGKLKWRLNDHGQDACSFIMPTENTLCIHPHVTIWIYRLETGLTKRITRREQNYTCPTLMGVM